MQVSRGPVGHRLAVPFQTHAATLASCRSQQVDFIYESAHSMLINPGGKIILIMLDIETTSEEHLRIDVEAAVVSGQGSLSQP
jgi:hypothetical protein